MNQNPIENLRIAKRGPIVSIVAYLVISIAKLIFGYSFHSNSLIADGFNNLSDIVGNVALLFGLHLASQPADANHKFGHWKFEDLSSLITSFIMFIVGFQVLIQTLQAIFFGKETAIDPLGAIVGVISALIMLLVYAYNKRLSKRVKSSALVAASKDNLSDAITSIGTSIAIVAASLNLPIIDRIAAIVITFFILKTAYDIFMQSAFSLSDGFDNKHLKKYEAAILEIPKITAVKSQRGRTYGSNVYLDIVLEMNPDLSVYESHAITEQVEQLLSERFAVYDIDIHVEPSKIPEDELMSNVTKKLFKNEKIILSKIPDYEDFISPDFKLIDKDGKMYSHDEFIKRKTFYPSNFEQFHVQSISQKTKLISYVLEGNRHTSIWRRNEVWYLIFHQISANDTLNAKTKNYKITKLY
ncbi:cation diffusion facilitator family transporter [Streptococcus uberis]|uniref:cation diffusion facilitator family transporter n=1 Tax=Streptococcus uberis TaxID=1349 RepID=UPI0012B55859|nr:cation diffusion facilitator family transporter [Streptococcus uberis]MBY4764356.1 cation diffusion facilitator family transporter [Streptococcus uberis]MCK1195921.1 cation diffusion facilitator family transporter [Streptococcus uberis]MCV6816738.1 cation diffusion facilitator family transporter [Streptococcus uberis]MCZ8475105.1 cation diffusion facilitator family transporter [Streptococcus uberis]MTB98898.1 cation diffusion facilitator family transporter [Streptococcus uberis]